MIVTELTEMSEPMESQTYRSEIKYVPNSNRTNFLQQLSQTTATTVAKRDLQLAIYKKEMECNRTDAAMKTIKDRMQKDWDIFNAKDLLKQRLQEELQTLKEELAVYL